MDVGLKKAEMIVKIKTVTNVENRRPNFSTHLRAVFFWARLSWCWQDWLQATTPCPNESPTREQVCLCALKRLMNK